MTYSKNSKTGYLMVSKVHYYV